MQVKAHAKINLSLRVLRQREDGFHEIETVVAPITLHDSLHFETAAKFQFHCNDPALPGGEDNLVVRAAGTFFAETNISPRVSITLRKNIPHGAGLGGGSSDAAATLRGLNALFAANLALEKLQELAARIGSDVPFFLHGGAAVCRGRGEIVDSAVLPARLDLFLFKPRFGVATAWAYSRSRNAREIQDAKYSAQEFQGQNFVNDLERPVFEKFPFLAAVKNWLLQQTEVGAALMSGSGSTVFAVLKANADVEALTARARQDLDADFWIFATQTL
jgi:4-diphosphocytidyl-2-C-methyl-D-erythritol kinase